MLEIFRRRNRPSASSSQLKPLADRLLGPVAMASAVSEIAAAHAQRVRTGDVAFPIMKAAGAPILKIWHHLRLETFMICVRYGEGFLFDLAEVGNRPALLTAFLEQNAHLQFPQPSGTRIDQSVQGMWQAYLYLMDAGRAVADPLTDPFQIKARRGDILANVKKGARQFSEWWASSEDSPMPSTLFTLFFDDVNAKTKSIALSHLLGPRHDERMKGAILDITRERGAEVAQEFRQLVQLIECSANPDQAIEAAAGLEIANYL